MNSLQLLLSSNSCPINICVSLVAQMVQCQSTIRRHLFHPWVGKIPWRRDRLPTPVFLGFPGGSDGKEATCNVEDLGSIPGLGTSSGEGNDYPLQYSCLENSMNRGAWRVTVHGVAKTWTHLSHFHFQDNFREKSYVLIDNTF